MKHVRFAAYSDIHHHEYTNGVTGDDIEALEDEFTEFVQEHNAHAWIFGGDRFLARNPQDISRKRADAAIRKRSKLGIPGIMLVGNHDRWTKSPYSGHNLYVVGLHTIPNTYVLDKRMVFCEVINGCKVAFHAVPAGHKVHDGRFVFDKDLDFNVCLFHDILKGSRYTNGILAPEGITPGLLDMPEFSVVLGGDNHQPQDLDLHWTRGVYIGAPAQHNWGDVGSDRGFITVDLFRDGDTVTREIKFYPSKASKFLREEVKLKSDADLSEFVSKLGDRWKNNIIRVVFTGTSEVLSSLVLPQIQDKLVAASGARQVKAGVEFDELKVEIPTTTSSIRDDGAEWKAFVNFKKTDLAGFDIERLEKLGLDYIIEADNE